MQPRIVASIEARMNSSRFPGKVLTDICGEPTLMRLVSRLKRSRFIDDIVLATTTNASDRELKQWADNQNIKSYCGSEEDVLQRVVDAHQYMQSDIIVEITGDCPLLDPDIIDMGIEAFLHNDCDVVTNVKYPSYPMGIDVQIFRSKDLKWVSENIGDPAVREHVSLYFYENPSKYRLHHLFAPLKWCAPNYRFQFDYPEDHQFISEIFHRLIPKYGDAFGINEIMQLLRAEPGLLEINQDCLERTPR